MNWHRIALVGLTSLSVINGLTALNLLLQDKPWGLNGFVAVFCGVIAAIEYRKRWL